MGACPAPPIIGCAGKMTRPVEGLAQGGGTGRIGDIPQLHRAGAITVTVAAAGQGAPVRAERDERVPVAGRGLDEALPVAEIEVVVVVPGDQQAPVGAEGQRADLMPRVEGVAQGGRTGGIGGVPQPDRGVAASAGQDAPVGTERHRRDYGTARQRVRGTCAIEERQHLVRPRAGQRQCPRGPQGGGADEDGRRQGVPQHLAAGRAAAAQGRRAPAAAFRTVKEQQVTVVLAPYPLARPDVNAGDRHRAGGRRQQPDNFRHPRLGMAA